MPTVSLSELQDRVYDRLENNLAFYPKRQVTWAINDAIAVMQGIATFRIIPNSEPILSEKDKAIYSVPAEIALPLQVYWEGRPLHPTTIEKISLSNPLWMVETSYTAGVPASNWVKISPEQFGIWPADPVGGADIQVVGVADAVDVADDDETINLVDAFVELLEDDAFLTLTMKEGGKVFSDALKTIMPRRKSKLEELKRWRGLKIQSFRVEAEIKS